MVKPLTVYKAGAGSGKTFTLATEYIELLVKNPMSYRNILAVTFTNKATEEMKKRILSQLYGISKQLPDSEDYMQKIASETYLSRQIISQRAGEALSLLLHNYNYFHVETIDTFFQSVLRNLARELDLTANLRVSLNDIQVEEEAVNQLIDSLNHTDTMLQWLLNYIMQTISDDHSWNIIGQLKQFGRTIFRDYYKEHSTVLNQIISTPGFLDSYISQIRQIRSNAENRMKSLADEFFNTLEQEGFTDTDLSYGKTGVYGFFVKLHNGQMDESIVGKRVTDCMVDASKWYSKKHQRAEAIHYAADSLFIPILRRAVNERPHQWKMYKSADLTLCHLNQLRLLGSIEKKVRDLNEEANRFLLSDTQQLLHTLVKDSDSPFIFEKIGTRLEHVMIDEFQDTSTVQWKNFKILLQECMSHSGTENIIVGDVKQSIYRWRSGDWRLLNAIDQEFPHSNKLIDIHPLKTNFRSEQNIINFNNIFFTEAACLEYEAMYEQYPQGAEQLKHAYEDVIQEIPQKRCPNGFVSIRLLPPKDYQEQTLCELVNTVKMLKEQGINPKQIAILVRTNNYIPIVADFFAENMPDTNIVSDEAFRLDSSVSVCLLIKALHLLTHPDDKLSKATIVKIYQQAVLGNSIPENELFIKGQPLDCMLPEAYILHTEELLHLPLYELTERLYTIFQLNRLNEQSAYICYFYDKLNQFTQDNSTDINAFVAEWEETLCSKTIQGSEKDGIRILSIHKSKGLEFDNVIIPFCDWQLEHNDILWCKPKESPFDALPIIPIDYSRKQMMGTIYEEEYLNEHLQNTVDNLNLLYVAFTRACQNLFVFGQRSTKNTRSTLIETVLPKLKIEGFRLDGLEDEEAPLTLTYGILSTPIEKSGTPSTSDNVFLQPVNIKPITIETFDVKTEFRQSNRSRDFIDGDEDQQELNYIKIGSVLHNVFSTIHTSADIENALQQLQNDGVLYDEEVTREKIINLLHKRLDSEQTLDWFSGRWTLFNECTILTIEDGIVKKRRPDRVMTDGHETHVVDFKFGNPKTEYHQQVREYVQLLQEMGMPHVKGWLWYVYSNKIEEVK